MPIFDYKCPTLSCDTQIEKLVKSAETEVPCPSCGNPMKRKVSAGSFRLKGNGWYETDFKNA